MRRSTTGRLLIVSALALTGVGLTRPGDTHASGSAAAAAHTTATPHKSYVMPSGGALTAADVLRLSQNADQHVIVLMRDQYKDLPDATNTRGPRMSAIATSQSAVLSELTRVHASGVKAFTLINAVAATVSSAEEARLTANPDVQAVVPDRIIHGTTPADRGVSSNAASPASASPAATNATTATCTVSNTSLEPEDLQTTNTAFTNTVTPQAQNVVSGTGVTVAWIADGIDINNPDFIRPNGQNVFTDYQDFSGDGPNAAPLGAEAYGDASSIAAQGRQLYNLDNYINAAQPHRGQCIRILGMSPGASLIGLKVFGAANTTTTSNFVQAIQYAVTHGSNVINESFGGNYYPDTTNDPTILANDAAVAAGVTVVASTGDAGTGASTQGSPSTDPNIIAAGATTTYRLLQQVTDYGFQFATGGFISNNISSLSSAGPSYSGQQTVDIVAGGELGWALCSPASSECLDNESPAQGSSIQAFGGTSQSSPLTAGEAALVIQAYRQTHGGVSPSPRLVKAIIKSSATDLGIPSREQGAGLINSLKAVQLAESINGGTAGITGTALLIDTPSTASENTLATAALPNTAQTLTFQVTNVSTQTQAIAPSLETLAAPTSAQNFTVNINPTTAPTFVDGFGITRAYVTQTFPVAAGQQRLDAAIANDLTIKPGASVRMFLIDPSGRYAAYTLPQGIGNGYSHVSVTNPSAGTWTAYFFERTTGSQAYNGPVQFTVSTSNFTGAGAVTGPAALTPGQTGTYQVSLTTPATPGDYSDDVVLSDAQGNILAGVIPVTIRTIVPFPTTPTTPTTFSGTLTGGNGRPGAGNALTYMFDVPAGLRDLEVNTSITDTNYNLEGVLVDPNGQPIDVQSTQQGDGSNVGTLQFFHTAPQAGRYHFIFLINGMISGQQTSIPFNVSVGYNGASASAPGLPNAPGAALTQGTSTVIPVQVTNTGNTTKDFFVDSRLTNYTTYLLGSVSQPVPLPSNQNGTGFFVPTQSQSLSVAALDASAPISMDVYASIGAAPDGFTNNPDIEATSGVDAASGAYSAVAVLNAAAGSTGLASGLYSAAPSLAGPYPAAGATASTVQLSAVVSAKQFDLSATSSTGDEVANQLSLGATIFNLTTKKFDQVYNPLTLAPGQSGTINVTFAPNGAAGSTVSGTLYVDAVNAASSSSFVTGSGDEVAALPYAYTVAAPPTSTPVPPTSTPVPPTSTPAPPTATLVPTVAPTPLSFPSTSGTPPATSVPAPTAPPTSAANATAAPSSASTPAAGSTPKPGSTSTPGKPSTTPPCTVKLSLYAAKLTFGSQTFIALPSLSITSVTRQGNAHPKVTSTAPLQFDDAGTTLTSTDSYANLVCTGSSALTLQGTIIGGVATVHNRQIALAGSSFTITVAKQSGGRFSLRIQVPHAGFNRTYSRLQGTVSIKQ